MPEEFYNLKEDPDCLNNLIDDPEHAEVIAEMQAHIARQMEKTSDPMLKAFLNRDDRAAVDEVLLSTYGPRKPAPKRRRNKKRERKGR